MSYLFSDKIKFSNTPNFDSFSRLRTSNPFTLFDSSHRYRDNGMWSTSITGTGSATFSSNEGLVKLEIGTASGDSVIRETNRVFAYQPGKSLLVLNTFVFSDFQTNLRQRVGYFSTDNGVYLEADGSDVYFVERSKVTGTVSSNRVIQSDWNVDPLDGTGPSKISLDFTKSQILWSDFEWLGVGSVRVGFVIDGEFQTCHVFHHANLVSSTYMTTACLPIRYEITNSGDNISNSTMKQICSTVISEGGYELRGTPRTVTTPITTGYSLSVAGTYYPVISIRLRSTSLDSIVVPTGIGLLPNSNGNYSYKIIIGGTTLGGTWSFLTSDSSVEYNRTGTSISGGYDAISGFFAQTTQALTPINILDGDAFKFQLQRNSFTNTPEEFTICVASNGGSDSVFGSLDWQEITK